MSHKATLWALEQRGLTAAEFRVLVHLADRHNPDNGCFPSQERIALDAEMSLRTIKSCLSDLEDKGLIVRERLNGDGGYRIGTRYMLGFEISKVQDVHLGLGAKSCNSQVQNLHPNLVKEPVIEIDEDFGKNDLFGNQHLVPVKSEPVTSTQTVFDQFWMAYPLKVSKDDAFKAFAKAIRRSPLAEILSGLERYKTFWELKNGSSKDFIPHASTWLNQSRWQDEIQDHINALIRNVPNDKRTKGVSGRTGTNSVSAVTKMLEGGRIAIDRR